MTLLIWSSLFAALWMAGNLVVLPNEPADGWRHAVVLASMLCLICSMISVTLFLLPIFGVA